MKINNNCTTLLRLNKNEIIPPLLVIFLILLSIGSSGCLLQNKPGQSPTNSSVTSPSNNSPVPSSNILTPIPTIIDTSEQSGVRIFKSEKSICIGQTLTYGLINEGNSTIQFGCGDPYWIQIYDNGKWESLFLGGGFQAYCDLHPGDKMINGWGFTNDQKNGLFEYGKQSDPNQDFIVRAGLYRIMYLGENVETHEKFTLATEFTINDCQS